MSINMSKGKAILFLIALFLTNVSVMGDMVLIPAVGGLFSTFDNIAGVNFIVSGPALICVFSALVSGKLMEYISKKTLLIISFVFFSIGAIFGVVVESLTFMIAMRCLVGVSMGMTNAGAMALIAEVYIDEDKRSTVMGAFNAIMAAIGAVLGIIAGQMAAANGWQSVFKIYWISIPILVLMVLFLPNIKPLKEMEESTDESEPKDKSWMKSLGALIGSKITFNIIYMVVYYQIAVFVAERALGDEALAGLLSSLGTVGSCLACIAFGFTYSKMKRGSIIAGYGVLTLCYILLYFANSPLLLGIACFFMGAAFGHGFSYFFMQCTLIVPPDKVSMSISAVTAADGLGMFLSTYVATILMGILGTDTLFSIVPIIIGIAAIGTVLSIILTIRHNKEQVSELESH